MELIHPGNQLLSGNTQLYNVVVTSHAFIMIFFGWEAFGPFYVGVYKPVKPTVTVDNWLYSHDFCFSMMLVILRSTPVKSTPATWLRLHESLTVNSQLLTLGIRTLSAV